MIVYRQLLENGGYIEHISMETMPENANYIEVDKTPTPEEIAEANKPIVPETISRTRFIIQVFLTTGIKYEEIVAFIQNLPTEVIDEASKYIVLTQLRSCTHLDRNSTDFNLIADMMGITPEQRDEIFINGNS